MGDDNKEALDLIESEVQAMRTGRNRVAKQPLFPTSVQISRGLHRDLSKLVNNHKAPFRSRSEAVRTAISAMLKAYGYVEKEDW